jgi:hypothetical protein
MAALWRGTWLFSRRADLGLALMSASAALVCPGDRRLLHRPRRQREAYHLSLSTTPAATKIARSGIPGVASHRPILSAQQFVNHWEVAG